MSIIMGIEPSKMHVESFETVRFKGTVTVQGRVSICSKATLLTLRGHGHSKALPLYELPWPNMHCCVNIEPSTI